MLSRAFFCIQKPINCFMLSAARSCMTHFSFTGPMYCVYKTMFQYVHLSCISGFTRSFTSPPPPPHTHSHESKEQRLCSVDVLFLLDATGSIAPVINAAKEHIQGISKEIAKSDQFELRVGCVCYRWGLWQQDQVEPIMACCIASRSHVH
jgi:hypothetical protein